MALDRRVASSHFPYITVHVRVRALDLETEALLDTGFAGYLVLPKGTMLDGQPPDNFLLWGLADGSTVTTPAYLGTIRIGQREIPRAVVIELGDEVILGLRVMERFRVTLDYGREVVFEV